jgi:hypothetical protein
MMSERSGVSGPYRIRPRIPGRSIRTPAGREGTSSGTDCFVRAQVRHIEMPGSFIGNDLNERPAFCAAGNEGNGFPRLSELEIPALKPIIPHGCPSWPDYR